MLMWVLLVAVTAVAFAWVKVRRRRKGENLAPIR
jgi:hypothetical protein